ncbi:MAG: hypothetical protein HC888_19530 [Candidatus Competibacteraceae bacterium]|nr:hypothetical protein [Candidatus Competibacteraceae bacterium]
MAEIKGCLRTPKAAANSGSFSGQNIVNDTNANAIAYMVRAGSDIALSYTVGASSAADTYIATSANWTSSTQVIDSTTNPSTFTILGMTTNSDGSLNLLYKGGNVSGLNNAAFGVITNKSGSWTLATDTATRIANNAGSGTGTPNPSTVVYDRIPGSSLPASTYPSNGYLLTDSSDNTFVVTFYGTVATITSSPWIIWGENS